MRDGGARESRSGSGERFFCFSSFMFSIRALPPPPRLHSHRAAHAARAPPAPGVNAAMAPKKIRGAPAPAAAPKSKRMPAAAVGPPSTSPSPSKKARPATVPPPSPAASAPSTVAKATRIATQLAALYPGPQPCPLDHASEFQLLVAVVLSAQTTDVAVNKVTPALFAAAPDAAAMAALGPAGIEPFIRALGLAPTKARNVAATAAALVERHGGSVPTHSWAALEALPGVGHKTASVVRAMGGHGDAFPVDTHIHRLAARWGLSEGSNVLRTEADLKAAFSGVRSEWGSLHVRLILFGRQHCPARGHEAEGCPICSWGPFLGGGGGGW